MSACLRSQPKSAEVTGVAPRIASSLTLRDRERCLRGPSNSVHDAKFMIKIATQNPALICAFSEPPIGIEPMTYALRGCHNALFAGSNPGQLHVRRLMLAAIAGC